MTQQIKLYYDVMSPYSWIGFEVLHRYKQKWDLDLQLCPFQILKVREQSSNLPKSKEKAIHVGYDIARLAKFYNIPLKPPSNPTETLMVKGTTQAQQLLTAANLELPDKVEAISRELWMRVWSRDEDITEDTSLIQACVKIGISNENSKKLLARSKDQDVINKLEATTQEAFNYGVSHDHLYIATGTSYTLQIMESRNQCDFFTGPSDNHHHLIGR
ncbi:glutathione S-transferase kappa 1-like isoform X2 [Dysidea avara]|uniref:glutathione S-transferase kappa 1-like isoform X2 n=1 Tax=Dysidea avara TaxID=196820 RepID=UPI00331B4200